MKYSAVADRSRKPVRYGAALLGVLLIAANLRVGFVSVGPLLIDIGNDLDISPATAGLLTGLPLISFAVFSPFAPAVALRLGLNRTVWVSLGLLALGILIRSLPLTVALWAGTAVLGAAIAFLNVLLPSLVKRDFPLRVSQVTGTYSAIQSASAAVGAALVVPLAHGLGYGWRTALVFWAGLALLAMAVLFPGVRAREPRVQGHASEELTFRSPWKSFLGWQVTIFMGLQSTAFFVLMGWLPSIERSHGVPASTSGAHLSIFLVVGTLSSLVTGGLLHRLSGQRAVAVSASVLTVVSYAGLALAPAVSLIWIVCGAAGCGSLIVTALSLFSLRTTEHRQAAALSGMAQSIGYALAACGPVIFGALYAVGGRWELPLWTMAILMVMLCGFSVLATRTRVIG